MPRRDTHTSGPEKITSTYARMVSPRRGGTTSIEGEESSTPADTTKRYDGTGSAGVEHDRKVKCQWGPWIFERGKRIFTFILQILQIILNIVCVLRPIVCGMLGMHPSEFYFCVVLVVEWRHTLLETLANYNENWNGVESIFKIMSGSIFGSFVRATDFDATLRYMDGGNMLPIILAWGKWGRYIKHADKQYSEHLGHTTVDPKWPGLISKCKCIWNRITDYFLEPWCIWSLIFWIIDYWFLWFIFCAVFYNTWDFVVARFIQHIITVLCRELIIYICKYHRKNNHAFQIYMNMASIIALLLVLAVFTPVSLAYGMAWYHDVINFGKLKDGHSWPHSLPEIPNACFRPPRNQGVWTTFCECFRTPDWKDYPLSIRNIAVTLSWFGHNRPFSHRMFTHFFMLIIHEMHWSKRVFFALAYYTVVYMAIHPQN